MSGVAEIAAGLSEQMRAMLLRARPDTVSGPPRCYGPSNTRKALRERGLGSGDYCYLTPLGEAVRNHLESNHE